MKLKDSYKIEEIENSNMLDIEENEDELIFYFNERIIGIINFNFEGEKEVFLNFSGTVNAKEKDFDNLPENIYQNYLKYFDFNDDLKVKGLGKYMYNYFINYIKELGIESIKSETFNEKIFSIKESLLDDGIIENIYIDEDGFNMVKL